MLILFIMLWVPMFLSSLRLTISNTGFTLGYDPNVKLPMFKTVGFIFVDLLLFLLHPIILVFRIASLKIQQEAIKKSRDLNKSEQYNKNFRKLTRIENQYASYRRLEINLESIFQMTLSLLLYFYATSSTTTTNSLKSVFNKDKSNELEIDAETLCENENFISNFYCQHLKSIPQFLPDIDPIYIIVTNFVLSFLSFTR